MSVEREPRKPGDLPYDFGEMHHDDKAEALHQAAIEKAHLELQRLRADLAAGLRQLREYEACHDYESAQEVCSELASCYRRLTGQELLVHRACMAAVAEGLGVNVFPRPDLDTQGAPEPALKVEISVWRPD